MGHQTPIWVFLSNPIPYQLSKHQATLSISVKNISLRFQLSHKKGRQVRGYFRKMRSSTGTDSAVLKSSRKAPMLKCREDIHWARYARSHLWIGKSVSHSKGLSASRGDTNQYTDMLSPMRMSLTFKNPPQGMETLLTKLARVMRR